MAAPWLLAVARASARRGAWAEATAGYSASRMCAQVAAEACGSRSMMTAGFAASWKATARLSASVVFPAPPFCEMKAIVRMV